MQMRQRCMAILATLNFVRHQPLQMHPLLLARGRPGHRLVHLDLLEMLQCRRHLLGVLQDLGRLGQEAMGHRQEMLVGMGRDHLGRQGLLHLLMLPMFQATTFYLHFI